jgi:TonB family protein
MSRPVAAVGSALLGRLKKETAEGRSEPYSRGIQSILPLAAMRPDLGMATLEDLRPAGVLSCSLFRSDPAQQFRTMTRLLLLAAVLNLAAGCATKESKDPQYQIGNTGSRQTKVEAEQAHAGESPKTGPTAEFDSPPRVLSSRFPEYPRDLQRAGIAGTVVVGFTVEPDGSVSDPAIQGSSPSELAALTLNAIMQWKFAPAIKGATPVRTRIKQPFVFKIE